MVHLWTQYLESWGRWAPAGQGRSGRNFCRPRNRKPRLPFAWPNKNGQWKTGEFFPWPKGYRVKIMVQRQLKYTSRDGITFQCHMFAVCYVFHWWILVFTVGVCEPGVDNVLASWRKHRVKSTFTINKGRTCAPSVLLRLNHCARLFHVKLRQRRLHKHQLNWI